MFFSCVTFAGSICRVRRMLFEHETDRPSVQHHLRDAASVNAMKQTCVIVILAYFFLISPQFALKTLLKHFIYRKILQNPCIFSSL